MDTKAIEVLKAAGQQTRETLATNPTLTSSERRFLARMTPAFAVEVWVRTSRSSGNTIARIEVYRAFEAGYTRHKAKLTPITSELTALGNEWLAASEASDFEAAERIMRELAGAVA